MGARWRSHEQHGGRLVALFKRPIIGSCHQVSAKHLEPYLNEFEWRFNQRENPYLFRDTMIRFLRSPKMEFKELTEKIA